MSFELMQASIKKAEKYISENAPQVQKGKYRQRYHFMGQCGWINDPNGLIYFKGQYHFFYQFNPYSGFWSQMYWGHAVSSDLVHWTYLPIALGPSEEYDNHPEGGCFSGSAVIKDDKLYLIYTGTANHGNGFVQTQNVAFSEDGIHFTKYENNPVILPPADVPTDYFRDPKVWEHDGSYYLVCGAQRGGCAQALLYKSKDLYHWQYVNVLLESRGEWGYMWECPDFFSMKDKWVFMCSPMGCKERTTVYFVGDFDYHTGKFFYTVTGELDWGFDFYAPQTFVDGNGRRLMVGWANEWDWMPFWKDWGPTYQEGWCGSFSIPREVKMNDDLTLSTTPAQEIMSLRTNPAHLERVRVDHAETRLLAGDGIAFNVNFKIDMQNTTARQLQLLLRVDNARGLEVVCSFDFAHSEFRIDRSKGDNWSKGISRSPLKIDKNTMIDVEIFSDQSSVEIFINKGRIVHSMNIFADDHQSGIFVKTANDDGIVTLRDVNGYGLKSCFE